MNHKSRKRSFDLCLSKIDMVKKDRNFLTIDMKTVLITSISQTAIALVDRNRPRETGTVAAAD